MKDSSVGAASRRDYAQDVLYIAIEHMDVRRDCLSLAHYLINRGETPLPQGRAPQRGRGSYRVTSLK